MQLSWRARSLLAQWQLVPAPQTMKAHDVRNIVFSSSATVYGDPKYLPLDENHPVGGCTNPYGKSKYFIEEMIRDLCKAERVRSRPKARRAGNQGLFPLEHAGVTRQHHTALHSPQAATFVCFPRTGMPFSCAISTPLVPTSQA